MTRPELRAAAWRGREVIAGLAIVAFGFWCIWLGGWLLIPVGTILAALGAALSILAVRRMRFGQGVHAPGIVEVDEAQITYFGPNGGGSVSVPDLVELRLTRILGRRFWRLKQADGQALLVPVESAGADRLFDSFASLPGMDTQALVASLDTAGPTTDAALGLILWKRLHGPTLDSPRGNSHP
jgi:hypothetical protein